MRLCLRTVRLTDSRPGTGDTTDAPDTIVVDASRFSAILIVDGVPRGTVSNPGDGRPHEFSDPTVREELTAYAATRPPTAGTQVPITADGVISRLVDDYALLGTLRRRIVIERDGRLVIAPHRTGLSRDDTIGQLEREAPGTVLNLWLDVPALARLRAEANILAGVISDLRARSTVPGAS
jgi:hypothetical protein